MKIVPAAAIPAVLDAKVIVIHRDDGARFYVECSHLAVWVACEEHYVAAFKAWAGRLREHRERVEATRPWLAPGWLEGVLDRAYPWMAPIVDGVVSEWLETFNVDVPDDARWLFNTARMGRVEFERCCALPNVSTSCTFEEALLLELSGKLRR